jgi:predicted TIM-barrel fold metal-dependent hydrolase
MVDHNVMTAAIPTPERITPPPVETCPPAPKSPEWNMTGVNYRLPMPRPKVRGPVIDFHCHLFAARHAKTWFEASRHFGIDAFVTMTPLEEVMGLQRDWPGRLQFIAVPQWRYEGPDFVSDWLRRIEMFYNLGSRIVKFHAAPQTMQMRGRLDSPRFEPVFREVRARGMMIMTHIGDPELWYAGKYADTAKFGTRDEHYRMWEGLLEQFRDTPWIGAHLGGNPENLDRLQALLDRFPNLSLDCSATRWMAREISRRRDQAREFVIKNAERILFGSDQVSGDDRDFDFLASRWWTHRKLWETAYIGQSPICDPDLPADQQPMIRGLALPDHVLQKVYHDNAAKVLERAGLGFEI